MKKTKGEATMKKREYKTPFVLLTYFSVGSVLMASMFSSNGLAAFKNTWIDGGSF